MWSKTEHLILNCDNKESGGKRHRILLDVSVEFKLLGTGIRSSEIVWLRKKIKFIKDIQMCISQKLWGTEHLFKTTYNFPLASCVDGPEEVLVHLRVVAGP